MTDETPAERRAREKREKKERINLVNEQERKRRSDAQEEEMWKGVLDDRVDKDMEKEFSDIFGTSVGQMRKDLDEGLRRDPNDKEIKDAVKAIQDAQRAAKGGVFSRGSNKKAKGIIKSNKKTIQKAQKKTKGGFCSVLFLGLLGVGGGVLYGLYEAGAAIISAMR